MIKFNFYKFYDLTLDQLYAMLALRANVFVMEQNCHYLDPDGKDSTALHLLGVEDNELVAYARVFPPHCNDDNKVIFGRVVVAKSARGKGYAKLLMNQILDYCHLHYPDAAIKCSAQAYLKKFYEAFGFIVKGDTYMDAGIPHLEMVC